VRLPSGSQLERAMACPGSEALPCVFAQESEHATRGTVLHRFLEAARVDRDAALEAIEDDELRAQAAAIDLSVIPAGAESEVALGWHEADGATRYELDGHRGYPDDGRFHATLDLVGVTPGCVYVRDFKTGNATVAAADSWQLRFGALAAARLAGVGRANVGLLYLGHDGRWHEDQADLDEFDFDDAEEDLSRLARRLEAQRAGEPLRFATGGHCRYCPALTLCPAQASLVRAIVPTVADVETRLQALSPAERGTAWEKVKEAEDLVKRVKGALRVMAQAEPFPLPDGRMVKEVASSRRATEPGATSRLIAEVGVAKVAEAAKFTPKEVEESFGADVLASLTDAGLVSSIPVMQVRACGSPKKRGAKRLEEKAA